MEPSKSKMALLLGLRDVIVPVISLTKDRVCRFEALKAYSLACGYGTGDHDLSLILTHSIPALMGFEACLQSMALFSTVAWTEAQRREKSSAQAIAHGDFACCNLALQVGKLVHDITDFIVEARVDSMSELWISDIVLNLFYQMTFNFADPSEPMHLPVAVLDAPVPRALLSKIDSDSDIHNIASDFASWRVLDLVLVNSLHNIADQYGQSIPMSGVEGAFTKRRSVKLGLLFLNHCNIAEIFSSLHSRLCEMRSERVQMVSLAAVDIIFHSLCDLRGNSNDGNGNNEPMICVPLLAWQGVHNILSISLRRATSSRVLKQACNVTARVCSRFFQEAFGLPGSPWENSLHVNLDAEVVSYFRKVLNDLIPMVLLVLQAVYMCRYQRRVGERFPVEVDEEIERSINERKSLKNATKDTCMDVEESNSSRLVGISASKYREDYTVNLDEVREVRQDPFVEAYFAEMIAITPWSDADKNIHDCKIDDYELWRRNLDNSASALSSSLDDLFGANRDSIVHFNLSEQIYPFSSAIVEIMTLTGNILNERKVIDENSRVSAWISDETRRRDMLQVRLERFVELAQARLRGESISIMALWIQLDTLIVVLQADVTGNCHNSSKIPINSRDYLHIEHNREEPASAWSLYPDLTGRFLSSLVSLSDSLSPLTADTESSAFKSRIMQIVGHLGAPDLMSLRQGLLPSRDGQAIIESGSNIFRPQGLSSKSSGRSALCGTKRASGCLVCLAILRQRSSV